MSKRWDYLVSETQFATELVVTGLQKLCTVPTLDGLFVGYSHTYPLHVGLHAYTSGLERLCKLTIATHGFVTTGTFPKLKSFGHKIGRLLDSVEGLDLGKIPHATTRAAELHTSEAERPSDSLDPVLTETLERFANGAGRYEHLDSLWNDKSAVSTLDTWAGLCAQVTVSERVNELSSLRNAVINAIRTLCTQGDLEASGFAILDPINMGLWGPSSEVALHLFQKAGWVASTLNAVTYYTHQSIPLLGEVVQAIRLPADEFFQYSIAQIQDETITMEELVEHHDRFPEQDD